MIKTENIGIHLLVTSSFHQPDIRHSYTSCSIEASMVAWSLSEPHISLKDRVSYISRGVCDFLNIFSSIGNILTFQRKHTFPM